MHQFFVRPGFGSRVLLIEFQGDHTDRSFPNVYKILKKGLGAKRINRLKDLYRNIYDFDGFVCSYSYKKGVYEIQNDVWAMFVHAEQNNEEIIKDIAQVLRDSGRFWEIEVDFDQYI